MNTIKCDTELFTKDMARARMLSTEQMKERIASHMQVPAYMIAANDHNRIKVRVVSGKCVL